MPQLRHQVDVTIAPPSRQDAGHGLSAHQSLPLATARLAQQCKLGVVQIMNTNMGLMHWQRTLALASQPDTAWHQTAAPYLQRELGQV